MCFIIKPKTFLKTCIKTKTIHCIFSQLQWLKPYITFFRQRKIEAEEK